MLIGYYQEWHAALDIVNSCFEILGPVQVLYRMMLVLFSHAVNLLRFCMQIPSDFLWWWLEQGNEFWKCLQVLFGFAYPCSSQGLNLDSTELPLQFSSQRLYCSSLGYFCMHNVGLSPTHVSFTHRLGGLLFHLPPLRDSLHTLLMPWLSLTSCYGQEDCYLLTF